jgi:serine/threonine protein phosphatase PrpC
MPKELANDFRGDSASYVLLHVGPAKSALVLHAGDCLVGRPDADGEATWLLQPHTLSNAVVSIPIGVLAGEPSRHVLTRSFRSKRFITPDLTSIELDDRALLVATDGFWAELDAGRQAAFLAGQFGLSDRERDDRSVLVISRSKHRSKTAITGTHPQSSVYARSTSGAYPPKTAIAS